MTHEATIKILQQFHQYLTKPRSFFPKALSESEIKESYYVEYYFLQNHIKTDHMHFKNARPCDGDIIKQSGISVSLFENDNANKVTKSMLFIYFDGKRSPAGEDHGLTIMEEVDEPHKISYKTHYKRKLGQNQRTEWIENKLTDLKSYETGQFIFSPKTPIAC